MSELYQWNPVDASNVDPLKSGYAEGAARSVANNRVREIMGAVRRWYAAPEWLSLYRDANGDALVVSKVSDTVYRVVGADVTAISLVDRRVRMSPGNVVARIVSRVFAAGNTDVTVAEGTVPNGLTAVELYFATELANLAFADVVSTGFFLPATADSAGIQAAINAASAAVGGIVLLYHPNYNIDAAITVASDCVVFSAGPAGTVCTVPGSLNGIPFTMNSRSALVGLTINAAGQAFAGTQDAIRLATGATEVLIENVRIESANRDAIALLDSNQKVRIAGCQIITPGRDGVRIEDPDSDAQEITIADVVVENPARLVNGGRGLRLAGRVQATNLHVSLARNAPALQVGIELASKNASGLTHARDCSVRGFTITGTGEDATGLLVGGSECTISSGSIALTGNVSRGIILDSTGAAQVADFNAIDAVAIAGADIAVLVQADAYDNRLCSLVVIDSQTRDVEERGRRNTFLGCLFDDADAGAVVFASSEDAAFLSCSFQGVTNTAVELQATATRPRLVGCTFRGNTTNLSDATTSSIIRDNLDSLMHGTGSNTVLFGPVDQAVTHMQDSNVAQGFGGALGGTIAGMEGLHCPIPPNAARRYRVRGNGRVTVVTNARTITVNVHLGPLGTIGDPTIHTTPGQTYVGGSNSFPFDLRAQVPAGEKFSVSASANNAAGATTVTIVGDDTQVDSTLTTWLAIDLEDDS